MCTQDCQGTKYKLFVTKSPLDAKILCHSPMLSSETYKAFNDDDSIAYFDFMTKSILGQKPMFELSKHEVSLHSFLHPE